MIKEIVLLVSTVYGHMNSWETPQLSRVSVVSRCMMRFFVLVSVGTVFAMTSADATAMQRRGPIRCAPKHAKVLASNAQAQVYGRINEVGYLRIFGCARGRKRSYVLGETPYFTSVGGQGIDHETLAGTMVAYEEILAGEMPEGEGRASWLVLVRDLRTGRWVHRAFTGVARQSRDKGFGPLVALVLKSSGSVAWIAENGDASGFEPLAYEVHALDRHGDRLLASGTDIAPHSLTLKGSALGWMQHEQLFSTVLS